MPKTETEWQELRNLLAREVMKYEIRYLSDRRAYFTPEPLDVFKTYVDDWLPDYKTSQAMLVLKTLLKKIGCYAAAELEIHISPNRCRATIQNWVATDDTPTGFVRSPYVDNETQAICLVAESWLKEKKSWSQN